jgi:hypothetical protein
MSTATMIDPWIISVNVKTYQLIFSSIVARMINPNSDIREYQQGISAAVAGMGFILHF